MIAMGGVGREGAVNFKQERKWGLHRENVLVKTYGVKPEDISEDHKMSLGRTLKKETSKCKGHA